MFEPAELGHRVSKDEYKEAAPRLREELLQAQGELRTADFPVLLLFAGVDGAGKGDTANLLNEWMDPRGIVTRAFDKPSEEEAERPRLWRYWRAIPAKGQVGIFLGAWYHDPLVLRANDRIDDEEMDDRLDEIAAFERTLATDGALILKFWMHLGREAQRTRLEELEADPLASWRVTPKDWDNWKKYDHFTSAAERLILRTSTAEAPWKIVEGLDARYRSLTVGNVLLERLRKRLAQFPPAKTAAPATKTKTKTETEIEIAGDAAAESSVASLAPTTLTVLSSLKMGRSVAKKEYNVRLGELQGRLNLLHREARQRGLSTILVFEGWDAGGKGGAIRRVAAALDSRARQVIPIAAPTEEERAQHYLWRFWRHLPRAGRVTIFDRSWYGRVLVERVEGLASEDEWLRAYTEINDFERQLIEHGMVIAKFWMHIDKDEQKARFDARKKTPHKRWKLNEEDFRNRKKWDQYELAVNSMIERTSTRAAPWTLVEANDKRFARLKVLETVCDRLGSALEEQSGEPHETNE